MQRLIRLEDGREILLIGTAHVSSSSVHEVQQALEEYQPQGVCVELDKAREEVLKRNGETWKDLDLMSVIKKGRLFFLFVQTLLANFQKRVAQSLGIKAGEDMRSALQWANAHKVPVQLIDRDINVTLKRAWLKSSFWQRVKILSHLIFSSFEKSETLDEESLEKLKQEDVLSLLMEQLAKDFPSIKEVLIDERDSYLSASLILSPYSKTAAVLGAGHLKGVEENLLNTSSDKAQARLQELNYIPRKVSFWRLVPWLFTVFLVGILAWAFYKGGAGTGWEGLKLWFYLNGFLAALGAVLVGAHPVTCLVSLVSAPFTSLSPLVGVGMLAALSEAHLRKPRVKDFMNLSEDMGHFKGFFINRIAHVFLVFFTTSLGSTIGTFWGVAKVASLGLS